MKHSEAESACKGCQYACAVALHGLNQTLPDPNQEAKILCRAPIKKGQTTGFVNLKDPEKSVAWYPAMDECMLSPSPNQNTCERVATVNARLASGV